MQKIVLLLTSFIFLTSCNKDEELKKEPELLKREQIMDILISNGIEKKDISFIDFKETDNVLTFKTIEDFKTFITKKKIISTDRKNDFTTKDKIYKKVYSYYDYNARWYDMSCSGEIHRFLNLNISGRYRFFDENQNFKVIQDSELSSYLSGLTIGLSYEHRYGNIFYDNYYTHQIRFKGEGTINHNLFIEGIGTIFTSLVQFSGYIERPGGSAKLDDTYKPY